MNLYFHQQKPETCRYFDRVVGHSHSVELKETPHYQFCCGNQLPYDKYLRKSWQESYTDEAAVQQITKFGTLIQDIRTNGQTKPIQLIRYNDDYLIVDGNHRAAICTFLGREIKYELVSISDWLQTQGKSENRYGQKDGLLYQTVVIDGVKYYGRRDIADRMSKVAQRDTLGKRVLDLGSNIGGATFWAAMNGAKRAVGVEYDHELATLACRLNNFYKLDNVQFYNHDINVFLYQGYDTIFCFSMLAHIKNKDNILSILKQAKVVYFEGNDGTRDEDLRFIEQNFDRYEFLGFCRDGIHNNESTRPLYRIEI